MSRHVRLKKRFYIIIIILLAVVGLAAYVMLGIDSKTRQPVTENNKIFNTKYFQGKQEMPESYTKVTEQSGTLTSIKYKTKMIDGSGIEIEKTAMVYLPYGYDETKKYNTFYLMHGYGGDEHTFLGHKLAPRPFKNMLDNMMENGDIAPTIVVTPTYTQEYTDYYTQIEAMSKEVATELVPAVENTYSTYADTISKKNLVKSREHRAVGGFSMGGCTTWWTLMDHMEIFKYYLPTSMPLYYDDSGYVELQNQWCAERIHRGIINNKYVDKPFYVYAASGGSDFMGEATKMQAKKLGEYNEFKYTDKSFKEGNITFDSWKGHHHSYKESFPYIYNGLIRFYKKL